jgi:hypothetical protein
MLNNESLPDIDYYKFADVISRLPNKCDIRFIGAEPTLNKGLPALIRLTRAAKHRPTLLTNGIRLKSGSYTKELKDAGLFGLGISMNGGLDDDSYEVFDGGRFAKQKIAGLNNTMKYRIIPHVNVIVDPSNIHVLKPLLEFVIETALKHGVKFSPLKFPAAFRIKSIGQMGEYMKTKSFTVTELAEIVSDVIKVPKEDILGNPFTQGYIEDRSRIFKFDTKAGTMLGKITDWNVNKEGIPDPGNERRGILTDNYKIAPFFEYYMKQNDVVCGF